MLYIGRFVKFSMSFINKSGSLCPREKIIRYTLKTMLELGALNGFGAIVEGEGSHFISVEI